MAKHTKISAWIILGLAFFGAAAIFLTGQSAANEFFPAPDSLQASAPDLYKHPKIDGTLCHLIHVFRSQGFAAMKDMAERLHMDLSGDLLRVIVVGAGEKAGMAASAAVPRLTPLIAANGGRVEASFRNDLQSLLPIEAIIPLAAEAQVGRIRLPLKPRPCAYTSEGVGKTGASSWQILSPFHSPGTVKVAILDLGFTGYGELLGTELPTQVTARSFRGDGRMDTNVHGTACAEIVHDMAPEAELYLVNFSNDLEQHLAVEWMIAQGIDIISYSIGWTNAGDGKGTGPITDDVERAAAAGIVWCGAAGNDARVHWEAAFHDPNGNGYHNFPDGDEFLEISVPAQETVSVMMNWDDWGTWNGYNYSGSANDYDLELYVKSGASWSFLWDSTNLQNGAGSWPVEESDAVNNSTSTATLGLRIRKHHATRNCQMEIFAWGINGPIEYNVPSGSLGIPADSPYCIALGASDVSSDAYHSYSSRGPTHDGRVKPDFAAPAGVSGHTYGSYGFYGTSASTPHMAGAFALLKAKTPFTMPQIRELIASRALDLGDAGADNKFGKGRLKLR